MLILFVPRNLENSALTFGGKKKRRHSPYAAQVQDKPLTLYGKPALMRKPQ